MHHDRPVAVIQVHLERFELRARVAPVPRLGEALAALPRGLIVRPPLVRGLAHDAEILGDTRRPVGLQIHLPRTQRQVLLRWQHGGAHQLHPARRHAQGHGVLILGGQFRHAREFRRAVHVEIQAGHVGDGMVENRQRGRRLVDATAAAGAQQHQLRVDAHAAEQGHEEGRLVLAITEAALENLGRLVRLVAVDAELEADVARVLDDQAVDGLHLVGERAQATCRLLRGLLQGAIVLHLVDDQVPVPAADLFPGPVGADVQIGRDLGETGHGRLALHTRKVFRRELVADLRAAGLAHGTDARPARLVEVEGAHRRRDEGVVPAAGGPSIGDHLEVAEVVGEIVAIAHIHDRVLHLHHVTGAQVLEGDHGRAGVVVEAVPRLGEILLVAARGLGNFDRAAWRTTDDARLADLDFLPARLETHARLAAVAGRALGAGVDEALDEALGEAVAVHAHHRAIEQDLGGGVVGRRRAGEDLARQGFPVGGVLDGQILGGTGFALGLAFGRECFHVAAQSWILRPQLQGAPHVGERGLAPPRARLQAADLLEHAGVAGQAPAGLGQQRARPRDVATSFQHRGLVDHQIDEVRTPASGLGVEARRLGQVAPRARRGGEVAQQPNVGALRDEHRPLHGLGLPPTSEGRQEVGERVLHERQPARALGQGRDARQGRGGHARAAFFAGQSELGGNAARVEHGRPLPLHHGCVLAMLTTPEAADARQRMRALVRRQQRRQGPFESRAPVVFLTRDVAEEQQRLDRGRGQHSVGRRQRLLRRRFDRAQFGVRGRHERQVERLVEPRLRPRGFRGMFRALA